MTIGFFGRSHSFVVENGLSGLLKPLNRQLNVQHRRIVTAIEYDERQQQVLVKYVKRPRGQHATKSSGDEDDEVQQLDSGYRAHAVLCALPLGCLKQKNVDRVFVDSKGVHLPEIRFVPPLPARKREAIERMAMGSVNKMVLVFKKRFWTENFFFGRVNDKECARGEFFLYSSAPNSTVLNVHVAGAAANLSDSFSNEDLHSKIMQILGRIFGQECPALPEQVIITRWHEDEQTGGCFPYVPVGRTDEDYDTLAEPVHLPAQTADSTRPFLFFAGDHTNREFPGRLHGAFLSGLREAARIADTFLGPVNAPERRTEYEQVGRRFVGESTEDQESVSDD